MKFFIKLLLVAVLASLAQLMLPPWSVAVAAFIVGVAFDGKAFASFFSGFLGVGLLWLVYAWVLDTKNGSLLSTRVAQVIMLPSPFALLMLTAIVGGLMGGMGALTGNTFRKAFLK